MTRNRTPTVDEVGSLPREAWEDLCAALFALEGVHRVEDHHGKGNGLDGWKAIEGGVRGYQYRRLDDRLGSTQIQRLSESLALAVHRAPGELGGPLREFVAVLNIDLEPGHRGRPGELDLFQEFVENTRSRYGVEVSHCGVTRIHALLCQNSGIKPELFEDLPGHIDARHSETLRRLESLERACGEGDKARKRLEKLTREARIHYERSVVHKIQEAFVDAIRCLEDAWRLADDEDIDIRLRAEILTLLGSVRMEVGSLVKAIEDVRRASALLNDDLREEIVLEARESLGRALLQSQNFTGARYELEVVYAELEQRQLWLRAAQTATNLAQISIQQKNIERIRYDLARIARCLDGMGDPMADWRYVQTYLHAIGTIGNATFTMAMLMPHPLRVQPLQQALKVYEDLVKDARKMGILTVELTTRCQLALCLWHLDELAQAATTLEGVVKEAQGRFGKLAADALFNLALVRREQELIREAIEAMAESLRIYNEIDDATSAADARAQLDRFVRG